MDMAPPLTRICPTALQLIVMTSSTLSLDTNSNLAFGEKLAVIAMIVVL
jgi:hypothetical protein